MVKENCQMDNYGKFGKKLYFIDILAFEPGKLCPGVGILFRFFSTQGPEFCTEKLAVPGAGILTKNISGPGGR